jgi:hypothetical protein
VINYNVIEELRASPEINVRFFFREAYTGCDLSELNFDGDATWCYQEAGRRDAQAQLALG